MYSFLLQMTVILWNCFSILIDQECYDQITRHQWITESIFSTHSSDLATLVRTTKTENSVSMPQSISTSMKSFNGDRSTKGYVLNSLRLIVYIYLQILQEVSYIDKVFLFIKLSKNKSKQNGTRSGIFILGSPKIKLLKFNKHC